MVPAVGIDLGTTKSVVGVWHGGKCRIIPDSVGHQSIPSLVVVTTDERILAGRQAQQYPDRYRSKNVTISSVKRLMGRRGETGWGWWKTYPQEVSAFILAELKSQAELNLGQEIKQAVIAIPSHFDEAQRRATKEAAEISGLEVIGLLNEATAAVLAYGFHRRHDETALVFDFGGGTLDISIVDLGEGTFQVRGIEGDSKLGGDDFDQVIHDYVLDRVRQQYGSGVEWNPVQKAILKEAAEKAKVELSGTLATSIYFPGFLQVGQSFHDLNVHLERPAFQQLSNSLVDRAIALLRKALASANVNASHINSVLLLGGTSRIPFVRDAVRKELGRLPITGVDIETCVAQGAVIYAAVRQGDVGEVLLLDAIPSSYGIGLKDDVFSPLIRKNTTIPTSMSQVFTTTTDNQSAISIAIYQGERCKASENSFLGTIELRDIPPTAAGVPQIEVTFDVDANTIVRVSARDKGTGKQQTIAVKSPYGLSSAQVKVMRQRLSAWLSERRVSDMKSEINWLIPAIEQILSERAMGLTWEDVSTLKECCASLSETKTKNCTYQELASIIQGARSVVEEAQQKATQYERAVREINRLVVEVPNLAPLIEAEKPFVLLTQGVDLLKDYLQRGSSLGELQATLLAVRKMYEETKVDLIEREIEKLRTSDEMTRWVSQAGRRLADHSQVRQHLAELRGINSVEVIVQLLEEDDIDCQTSIQRSVREAIRDDYYCQACFFLIASSFIDQPHMSEIDGALFNESNCAILAFCMFNSLDTDKSDEVRRTAARALADHLPEGMYFAAVVDRISRESDTAVKQCLLDYINKHPSGVLESFLVGADPEIRARIAADEGLLVKLAREPGLETRMFALQSLASLSPPCGTGVSDVFAQALLDPASRIRLIALDFLDRQRKPSCLSDIVRLLQSEEDETVLERAVAALCNLRDPQVVPLLLRLLIERGYSISPIILPALEQNKEAMDDDTQRLFDLTRKVALEKRSLGFRDSLFLRKFSRKHPEMQGLLQKLKEGRAGR